MSIKVNTDNTVKTNENAPINGDANGRFSVDTSALDTDTLTGIKQAFDQSKVNI